MMAVVRLVSTILLVAAQLSLSSPPAPEPVCEDERQFPIEPNAPAEASRSFSRSSANDVIVDTLPCPRPSTASSIAPSSEAPTPSIPTAVRVEPNKDGDGGGNDGNDGHGSNGGNGNGNDAVWSVACLENGGGNASRLLLAIAGDVFDVTAGRRFYGENSSALISVSLGACA